jgi:cell division initiation protein
MIDLTPLDIRKKAGDFKKGMLGYDTAEVEDFLRLAADRFEELVKENLALTKEVAALKERSERLQQQVSTHEERQNAVQEALIMAQKLREDVRAQAERDAELSKQKAEAEIKRSTAAAQRGLEDAKRRLGELELRRQVFLQSFRAFLQKELDQVKTEEAEIRSAPQPEAETTTKPGTAAKHEPASKPEPGARPEPAAEAERPGMPESVRAEVLAALDSMSSMEPTALAEVAAPETANESAEPVEDPWVSALQDVSPYRKPEAGPSN